jgi:hypothetical protein
MKRLLLIIALTVLLIVGCATAPKGDWICIADVYKNGSCAVIPCSEIKNICKTGNYRMTKIYPLREIYIYEVGSSSRADKCFESAGALIKNIRGE